MVDDLVETINEALADMLDKAAAIACDVWGEPADADVPVIEIIGEPFTMSTTDLRSAAVELRRLTGALSRIAELEAAMRRVADDEDGVLIYADGGYVHVAEVDTLVAPLRALLSTPTPKEPNDD